MQSQNSNLQVLICFFCSIHSIKISSTYIFCLLHLVVVSCNCTTLWVSLCPILATVLPILFLSPNINRYCNSAIMEHPPSHGHVFNFAHINDLHDLKDGTNVCYVILCVLLQSKLFMALLNIISYPHKCTCHLLLFAM